MAPFVGQGPRTALMMRIYRVSTFDILNIFHSFHSHLVKVCRRTKKGDISIHLREILNNEGRQACKTLRGSGRRRKEAA